MLEYCWCNFKFNDACVCALCPIHISDPADNHTYAYADIVRWDDPFYPISYSSEVGVFSSPDGRTGWVYHGIVVSKGPPGSWDGAGIASPGAAVAA